MRASRNLFRSISSTPTYVIYWNLYMKPTLLKTLLAILHLSFWIFVIISIKALINQPPPDTREISESVRKDNPSGELIKAPECKN